MINIQSNARCPVYAMSFDGRTTIEDSTKYLNMIAKLLSKEDSFGLVFAYPKANLDRDKGILKMEFDLLKKYGQAFAEKCFGIAIIEESANDNSLVQRYMKIFSEKINCVNIQSFSNSKTAQSWLMEAYFGNKTN
jgi:hypothetical protein